MPRFTRAERAGNRLKKLGYTHQELADAIGYSRPYITSVLNGARSPACMKQIDAQLQHWEAVAHNERKRRHGKREWR